MGDNHTATGTNAPADTTAALAFIQRWSGTTASELATAQSFVMDLCQLLGVERPHPTPEQSYMFERPVTFTHGDGSARSLSDLGIVGCKLAAAAHFSPPF